MYLHAISLPPASPFYLSGHQLQDEAITKVLLRGQTLGTTLIIADAV